MGRRAGGGQDRGRPFPPTRPPPDSHTLPHPAPSHHNPRPASRNPIPNPIPTPSTSSILILGSSQLTLLSSTAPSRCCTTHHGTPHPAQFYRAFSLLHAAATNSHVTAVKSLLAAGVPVDVLSDTGATPLHIACMQDGADVVEALLQVCAACDAPCIRSHSCAPSTCCPGVKSCGAAWCKVCDGLPSDGATRSAQLTKALLILHYPLFTTHASLLTTRYFLL